MSLAEQLLAEARLWQPIEAVAVVAAILYLLLAIRENIWCWLFAAISTAIYVWVFATAKLYMEAALNVYYFGMAVYGWWHWSVHGSRQQQAPVVTWPVHVHVAAFAVLVAAAILNGRMLDRYTDAAFPYLDSATTWFAVWATFLVARKVLENWWYWLAINLVSIAIFWQRDLKLTSALFVVYVIMIPFGLIAWRRSWRAARPGAAA